MLLCAGIELDRQIPLLCAKAHGNSNLQYPTFGLALTVLPNPHWDALAPTSVLRHFKLIELENNNSNNSRQIPLINCALHIDEWILHYLAGNPYLDIRFHGSMRPVRTTTINGLPIADSHRQIVDNLLMLAARSERQILSCIQLWGSDEAGKKQIAMSVCEKAGFRLYEMPGNVVPTKPDESEAFVQLWIRESLLLGSALYISASDVEEPAVQSSIKSLIQELIGHSATCLLNNHQEEHNEDTHINTKKQDLKQLLKRKYYYFQPIFLSTTKPWTLKEIPSTVSQEVTKPLMGEQLQMWKIFLDMANDYSNDPIDSNVTNNYNNNSKKEDLSTEISKLVGQFDLDVVTIHQVVNRALTFSRSGKKDLIDAIADEVRLIARTKLSDLVQRINPTASLDDLVLPAKDKHLLSLIAMYC